MRKYEARNPQYREHTEFRISKNKFMKSLGFSITRIEPGYTEGEMMFTEMHEQQNGWLHGGVTSTILDMVQGFASYTMVEKNEDRVVTVEAKISYYNPGISEKFYARGWVDKPGRRFHFCVGELYYLKDGEEVIVAKGSATMAVI